MMRVRILSSGSHGNCTVVDDGKDGVMVDCGLKPPLLKMMMDVCAVDALSIRGVFITHEHSDHIVGAGAFSSAYGCPVFATEGTFTGWRGTSNPFPDAKRAMLVWYGEHIGIAGFSAVCLETSHDAFQPCAWRITAPSGETVTQVTDTGKMTRDCLDSIEDSDIVIIESNHDLDMLERGPYPLSLKERVRSDFGHLSNEQCAEALKDTAGSRKRAVFLAHLSENNNTPALALEATERIAGIKADCLRYRPTEGFPGDNRTIIAGR